MAETQPTTRICNEMIHLRASGQADEVIVRLAAAVAFFSASSSNFFARLSWFLLAALPARPADIM